MLAQNLMTAEALGIAAEEQQALVTVLGMLERGEIDDAHFDMLNFVQREDCGTVGCLCGWAYEVSGGRAFPEVASAWYAAERLRHRLPDAAKHLFALDRPLVTTAAKGAIALRSYLTTGEARWMEALAE